MRPAFLGEDRGVALPLTLVVILILAAIVLGLAHTTTGEIEIERLTRWDTQSQYLAQAGIEHLLFLLKQDKPADQTLAPVNFPPTPGQEFWYYGTAECQAPGCAGDPESRTWRITASGEIRRAGSGAPGGGPCTDPCLQRRDLRIVVVITYAWNGTQYRTPTSVTLSRWEEVYP